MEYVQDLAGAVRKHVTGLAGVLKDEMVPTAKITTAQVERLEEAAADQADELQRTERAAATEGQQSRS